MGNSRPRSHRNRIGAASRLSQFRLIVNGSISAVAFLVAATAVRLSALLTLVWASARPFGLINLVPLPGWAQFIAGFLLLDLSFYSWHIANHKFPWLWRFHNVHHMTPTSTFPPACASTLAKCFFLHCSASSRSA